MEADQCILVDEEDHIIGGGSKAAVHRRSGHSQDPSQAFGLHRAFSVLLFDRQDRLLLQQRARSKITFPLVWTNTCCSHPLHGQQPSEVDLPSDVASGAVPGVKRAAIRKLAHELGIDLAALSVESFTFLTRLHYCSADVTEPEPDMWGEHEMDYVLLARADVALAPNPEEVEAVRYVSQAELSEMMDPGSGLAWSPWFRLLAERLLPAWWSDLPAALRGGGGFADGQIHRLLLAGGGGSGGGSRTPAASMMVGAAALTHDR